MLATAGPVPGADGSAVGERFTLEWKWDGMRVGAYVEAPEPGGVVLLSRNARAVTGSYPELVDALGRAVGGRRVVLDGEIVALGAGGRPDFGALQQRMGVTRPSPQLRARVPVMFVVFDLLCVDDTWVLELGYDQRRALLDGLRLDETAAPRVVTSPAITGLDPATVLRVAAEQGMEGVVAKRRDAGYQPGRSPAWVKTPLWRTAELVIGGWAAGRGRRTGLPGALILGLPDPEAGLLRYVGHVGTGFTDRALDELQRLLAPLTRPASPFAGPVPDTASARWVDPVHVGEVRFRTWTTDRHLRHPSWRGLRPDRTPDDL